MLGTSKGYIFEADIGSDGDRVIQNNFRQVKFKLFYFMLLVLIVILFSCRLLTSVEEKKVQLQELEYTEHIKLIITSF